MKEIGGIGRTVNKSDLMQNYQRQRSSNVSFGNGARQDMFILKQEGQKVCDCGN